MNDAEMVIELLKKAGLINSVMGAYSIGYESTTWSILINGGSGDITVKPSRFGGIEISFPLLVTSPESIRPFLCLKSKISGFICVSLEDKESAYLTYNYLTSVEDFVKDLEIAKEELVIIRDISLIIASSLSHMNKLPPTQSMEDTIFDMISDQGYEDEGEEIE
jgi:hypothetical protein